MQATGTLHRQHDRFAHPGLLQQARLDFAQLDSETANFHLVVDTANVLDHPVGVETRQVAGAIQARARRGKRIGDKAFGRQLRSLKIPPGQQLAADHQLAHHADRSGQAVVVQYVSMSPRQRPADGQGQRQRLCAGQVLPAIEGGGRDGGFGGAVGVEQFHVRQPGLTPGQHAFGRHRLATAVHLAQRGVVAGAGGGEFLGHHVPVGGGQVHDRDPLLDDLPVQGFAVPDLVPPQHHRGAADQRPEQLLAKGIEVEGGELQGAVAGTQAVIVHRGERVLAQGPMTDGHALGPAGGTGGEHDIGQVAGGQWDIQIARVGVAPGLIAVQAQAAHTRRNRQALKLSVLTQHQMTGTVFNHA
ncbi:hypothetical protein D3C85_803330 [compost metagenome]